MDETAHVNASAADELDRLRTRMADAVAGCARCLATVATLSEATPPTPAARRERCDGLCGAINSLSDHSGEFHQAHRDAGGGWPADAPPGLTFNALAAALHDAYFRSCELLRTLSESAHVPGPGVAARSAALRRVLRVLEDAAEYLRPGGEWSPSVAVRLDADRVNAAHAAEATAAAEYGVLVLDKVTDVDGREVPVTGNSCLVVPGRVPSVCPHADPRIGPTVMGPVRRVLLDGTQRELLGGAVLPEGVTLHWVGRVAASRGSGTCPCHPAAPSAAPAHAHLWAGVATATTPTPIGFPAWSPTPPVSDDGRGGGTLDPGEIEGLPASGNSSTATAGPSSQRVSAVPGAGIGLRSGVAADPASVAETLPQSPWSPRAGGALQCSPDCGVVRFGGSEHHLSGTSRAVFEYMLGAYEHRDSRDTFTGEELIDAVGSSATRLRDALRPSGGTFAIWGTFVVEVEGRRGFYRFRLPPFGEESSGPL